MSPSKDQEQRVFDRVCKLVAVKFGKTVEEITRETHFINDLEADSLDLVELVMGVEEEFEGELTVAEISDEDAEKLQTVGAAVDWITAHWKE